MTHSILCSHFKPIEEKCHKRYSDPVYRISYHLILFTPKQQPIITGRTAKELEILFKEITLTKGYGLFGMVLHPDHAHLILTAKPTHYIPTIVKDIVERTSYVILNRHREIQKKYRIKKLWSGNFYIETLGNFNREGLKRSLQDTKEHLLIDEWSTI
ncbi:MAG: IS200/IS605 family transposase [Thermodesulfobacteriota bacterium]|nr:IS200/IS605 family transposase [Thermodesulfobacteriota bacterium]